jgi:hypothetical protein
VSWLLERDLYSMYRRRAAVCNIAYEIKRRSKSRDTYIHTNVNDIQINQTRELSQLRRKGTTQSIVEKSR